MRVKVTFLKNIYNPFRLFKRRASDALLTTLMVGAAGEPLLCQRSWMKCNCGRSMHLAAPPPQPPPPPP